MKSNDGSSKAERNVGDRLFSIAFPDGSVSHIYPQDIAMINKQGNIFLKADFKRLNNTYFNQAWQPNYTRPTYQDVNNM